MPEPPLEKIHIRDLSIRCIIGIEPDERAKRQDVMVNVTLHTSLRRACKSDDVDDTIDYKRVKQQILEAVEESRFHLLEALAHHIAQVCLADPQVRRVDVVVDKPGALRFARSVAVELSREQEADA